MSTDQETAQSSEQRPPGFIGRVALAYPRGAVAAIVTCVVLTGVFYLIAASGMAHDATEGPEFWRKFGGYAIWVTETAAAFSFIGGAALTPVRMRERRKTAEAAENRSCQTSRRD
ncbi:hypothetical protein AXK56_22610 [Tsukamurella pulmonis]|uniref:Uncharacterized protein n=1 Tax=Tsukamurella pulmonis TaxID=47312 RepID=A0A1H1AE11_9ACTN|nr:hypothetical protein [Tsukamurella pulmonis]KXO92800.1 hypothetical protein AXK56_22610 [Tsukamurella pulmonis]SDQ37801.1 hypothetical protein SAMN04489765_0175 [Tsukamurella pulmonis]SUQ39361.1 Uncharacterised protein [Tsukamurella pulmonis]